MTATVVLSTLINTYMLDKSNLKLVVGVEARLINVLNAQNILIYVNATGFDSNNGYMFPVQKNLKKARTYIERRCCNVVWCCVC